MGKRWATQKSEVLIHSLYIVTLDGGLKFLTRDKINICNFLNVPDLRDVAKKLKELDMQAVKGSPWFKECQQRSHLMVLA